jgi:hypothetical protein
MFGTGGGGLERNLFGTQVRGPMENEAELLTLDEASARVGDIPLFAEAISGSSFASLRTATFRIPACLENLAFRTTRCLLHGSNDVKVKSCYRRRPTVV